MIKKEKKEKMKRNNIKILVVSCLFLILNSCGIPKTTIQENKVELPSSYADNLKSENSSGKVKWKDFFEDPYLQKLIDSTLVNNKELNILMQKVNMAQNEIWEALMAKSPLMRELLHQWQPLSTR